MDGSPRLGLPRRGLSPFRSCLTAAGPAGLDASRRMAADVCVSLSPAHRKHAESGETISAQNQAINIRTVDCHRRSREPRVGAPNAWSKSRPAASRSRSPRRGSRPPGGMPSPPKIDFISSPHSLEEGSRFRIQFPSDGKTVQVSVAGQKTLNCVV
jgi:hypothetical protein